MSDIDPAALEAALSRHTSATGEVYPSALDLIQAEEAWTGRMWDVGRLVMRNQGRMRYLAGGNRPGEVAACVARWAESGLSLDEMTQVFESGGYDPEPFETLARSGHLRSALYEHDGSLRMVHGERAGTWISDELALASEEEILQEAALIEHPG